MSIFFYFIQSIPESIGLVALSLAFARVPLRWKYIIIGGTILSILSYIIRSLPLTFGFHLPVMLFYVFLFIIFLTNVKLSRAVLAVFSSLFVLFLLEYIISTVFFAVSGMNLQEALAKEVQWAMVGIFQATCINLIAVFVSHFIKPIQESWKK